MKKSKLEKEFEAARQKALAEIDEHLKTAHEAVAKAELVADKYGIPFYVSLGSSTDMYLPASFQKKFGKLDWDYLYDLGFVMHMEDIEQYVGWTNSSQAC